MQYCKILWKREWVHEYIKVHIWHQQYKAYYSYQTIKTLRKEIRVNSCFRLKQETINDIFYKRKNSKTVTEHRGCVVALQTEDTLSCFMVVKKKKKINNYGQGIH